MSWKGPLDESISYEWRDVPINGGKLPAIRTGATSCLRDGHMYLFCGFGAGVGRSADVWRFNFADGLWNTVQTKGNNSDKPSKRDGHSTTEIGDGKILLFGGQGEPSPNEKSERTLDVVKTKTWCIRDLQNDLYEFDCKTDTWKMLCPEGGVPLCRRGHSAIYLPKGAYATPQVPIGHLHHTAHSHTHTHNHSHAHTHASSSPKKGKGASEEVVEEYLPIPDNSLVVFGGSGMEVSKYIEAVYNDVWVYNLDTGRWNKTRCRGIEPKPLFDHRCVRVGHLMLVIGGITGTNAKAAGGTLELTDNQDVMVLNMKTLVWSHLEILNIYGKPAKLNIHGHSLVADPYDEGILYLFGGKDTIDGKRAAMETIAGAKRLLKKQSEGHAFMIDLHQGTMRPIVADNMAPENRYEHLSQRAVVDGQAQERPPAPKRKAGMRIEPIMYLFGGARTESTGLCVPTMHSLVRVFTYTNPELMSISGSKAPRATESNPAEVNDDESLSTHHTADASSVYTGIADAQIVDEDDLKQPSIWQKKQMMDIQTGSSQIMRVPSSWNELKLALSCSMTDKRSAHLPPNSTSPGGALGRSQSMQNTTSLSTLHADTHVNTGIDRESNDNSAQPKDESTTGMSAKQIKRKEIERLRSLGHIVLPLVKGKAYKDAKNTYFTQYPAPVPPVRTYHANALTLTKSGSQSRLLSSSQTLHK